MTSRFQASPNAHMLLEPESNVLMTQWLKKVTWSSPQVQEGLNIRHHLCNNIAYRLYLKKQTLSYSKVPQSG